VSDRPALAVGDELLCLERAGWEALSTSAEAAVRYYRDVLASSVLMLLPGGLVVDDRAQVIESMQGPPWDGFELSNERVLTLGEGAAVVAYRGSARRGAQVYEALFSSTYVRRGRALAPGAPPADAALNPVVAAAQWRWRPSDSFLAAASRAASTSPRIWRVPRRKVSSVSAVWSPAWSRWDCAAR
jgi:hypothetical protein